MRSTRCSPARPAAPPSASAFATSSTTPSHTHLAHRAEALLAAADRAQHIEQIVAPALAAGRHVVSDRTVYSTLAYQGYGRGLDLAEVRRINDWAVDGHWPELVLLLDAPTEVLERRMRGRELDRFEQEDHELPRAGPQRLPRRWRRPSRNVGSSSTGPPTSTRVADAIRRAVRDGWGS